MEIVKNDELPENLITPTIIQRALLEVCVYGIVTQQQQQQGGDKHKNSRL
jgi:hypothetical protein